MTKEEYIDTNEYGYDADKGIWSKAKERFLKGTVDRDDYVRVTLNCTDGKGRKFQYHRALWYLAYGAIPDGYEVNHIDENKQNNALSNLNLMTHKENVNWGTCIQRRAAKQRGISKPDVSTKMRGRKLSEEHKAKLSESHKGVFNTKISKPVVAIDEDNNVIYEFSSIAEAGRQGFCQACVGACCRGEQITHKGLRWYYKEEYEKLMWEEVMIGET